MSKKQNSKDEADKVVRNIKRQTRRKFNAEEKIRIVLAGLRGEESIAEHCRQEGIHQNWYDRYLSGGYEALEDQKPCPSSVWNKVPDVERKALVDLALDEPELSPRELAVRFTEEQGGILSPKPPCTAS